ncbi:Sensor histidine kinase RcsC [Paraburkholderia domus]|uniref:ATP-binding protein n=1 Tax=Paraburkholderia domus TaxID=2793075 RepID=UPI00191234ED|nr:ATP-binding protein [Paraburkholderia domus]MBK5091386.1 response regulator [Burkholderia sp. R-69927]MBK5121273.1 response regulator [Burkholderia sp. R-69980]MBK5179426.1 response regulator [Burkholderia sp. R-69749]MCI0146364.1 response regulator [Paraburkholderia sediminicola]CAE6788190.1 Sensor histidine kinase RcsC [Paraburkholderia domus]
MQKILDRTQESLAQAFASLAHSAKRQQRVYLATIASLMLIVVVFALLLAVLAADKQLDYRRAFASQSAAGISLLLHRQESFLRRAELTLDYYHSTDNVLRAPASAEEAVRQYGATRGTVQRVDAQFDLLVGDATRAAWGPQLGPHLWRIYEAAQSTLVTQQSFELPQRAILLGLNEDYAAILPSLAHPVGDSDARRSVGDAPLPQPAMVTTLREALERELQAQTGKRVPAKGERIWLGPYRDPLTGVPVISAVSAYFAGDTPTTLIVMSIPLAALAGDLSRPGREGTLLLMSADRRVMVSSPPVDAATATMLQDAVAHTPPDSYRYTRDGAILIDPLVPGFGSLVSYLSWRGLVAALGWQLAVLAGLAVLVLAAIALTARLWGLRLLRSTFAETSRALESETINHILVSATPVGLCIVRRSDFSIITANALADELLHIEAAGNRLPPHVVGEFRVPAPGTPSVAAFARIATFVAPALPQPPQAQSQAPLQSQPAPDENASPPAQFLQFTYASARYAGEDVLFCAILDVTVQHALEQQLRLAQQTSEAAMRARSNFFASMSHEIRTPLNALLGNLELFARTPGLEAHAQRLKALGVAADALRRIVNDILDFSKIDAGEMKLVTESFRPLDDFENIALSYAPMTADRAIRFYAHLSPTLDRVLSGDRTRIAQIVNNLLSNAFKFTSCGKITLNADVTDDLQGRPTLICRVCDSGIGMDQVLVARIFSPFVQGEASTSSRYGGTGLGLSICARLCELMGGHISVESVLGVGSAFSVSIPLAMPPDALREPAVEPARRGNVLVLSQERESGQIIDSSFHLAGWTVHTVVSMRSAQAWLRVNRPDAMVVTGEYDLDAIAALRAVHPAGVVWITRTGPHRPTPCGEGVLEVTEFSRKAILAAVDIVATGAADVATTLPPAPAVSPPAVNPALQGLTVLVAEDNPLIQTLVVEQLSALGCLPTIAGDGRQALAEFERARFEVVMTDIHMPVMDGYELLAALRRTYPDVPVLAFSAVTDSRQAEGWRERGFTGYVAKPASLSELETALLAVASMRRESSPETEAIVGAPAAVVVDTATVTTHTAAPADSVGTLSADDKARYTAMLKAHLQNDLPKLMAIVEREDRHALRDWAHSAGGAFLVVQTPQFTRECHALQRLCQDSERWTTEMDARAISLHDALCEYFGLDETSAR